MGAMFDMVKGPDGRSARDVIRERRSTAIANMGQRGGMAGWIGRSLDQARANRAGMGQQAVQQPSQQPQPVEPRSEPALGSMFSSKPDRAMYGNGRQMQKGWWP